MDKRNNKRCKKLQIKRKQIHNNPLVKDFIPIDVTHEEENFKIKRFMKDVKQYRGLSPGEETSNNACDSIFKSSKEKVKDTIVNIKDDNTFKKHKDTFKERNCKRKDGLFMRGVITKCFNKGLMPPLLNARTNGDLQKMIDLANGKNYKKCNKSNNETSTYNQLPKDGCIDRELCDMPCIEQVASPIVSVENENTVIEENNTYKSSSDLYLQFTHFVTRSLLNSGIDKQVTKGYSDSIKEYLLKTYHNKTETQVNQDSSDNFSPKLTFSEIETPIRKTVIFCPSTSKSEDKLERTKFTFVNNSQLSDDIVIRKQSKPLYTSGIDYLKAVYNENSQSSKNLLNIDTTYFSPIQENDNLPSFNGRSSYFNSNNYEGDVSYGGELIADNSQLIESLDKENVYDCCHSQNPSTSLQYFPGNSNGSNLWNTNFTNNRQIVNTNLLLNKQADQEHKLDESPKYISLLPSNRRFQNDILNNLCSGNYCSSEPNLKQSIEKSVHQSLFSLPVRIPPMTSPDFRYIPRKMF